MAEAESVTIETEQSVDDFIAQENRAERAGTLDTVPEAVAASGVEETLAEPAAPTVERDPTTGQFTPKPGKPRDDPRARMLDATAKEAAAKRERDEARAENARLKAELEASRRPAAPPQSEVRSQESSTPTQADWKRVKALPGFPRLDEFENYEDWNIAAAMFVHETVAQEREVKAQQSTQRQQQEAAHHTRETTWQGRLQEARAKDPTFDSRVNPDTPLSAPMQFIIKESPMGIELLTWLSDHQEESQRLSTLHPAVVLRELGKLEARLEAASPAAAQPPVVPAISRAKPPIKPLGTSPTTPDPYETSDDTSTEEWIRRENAKERRARLGR